MDPLPTVTKVEDLLGIFNVYPYNLCYCNSTIYIPRFCLLKQARKKCFQLISPSSFSGITLLRHYSTLFSSLYMTLYSTSDFQHDTGQSEVIPYFANSLQPEFIALDLLNFNIDFSLWILN